MQIGKQVIVTGGRNAGEKGRIKKVKEHLILIDFERPVMFGRFTMGWDQYWIQRSFVKEV